MPRPDMNRQALGSVLVALQFGLLAVLAWQSALTALRGSAAVVAGLLLAASAAIGLWALQANRPGNFNIHPTPRPGGALVQHGPYRWVRHPMYSAVIGFGGACAWSSPAPWAWPCLGALVAVLYAKSRIEERWMLQAHAGYAAYRARTRRFVPYVF